MNQKGLIGVAVRLIFAGKRIHSRKWSFLGLFLFAFFSSVVTLASLDLLPEAPTQTASNTAVSGAAAVPLSVQVSELPVKIEAPSIGLVAAIANPTTTTIEVLDRNLLKGAVRYPTSAKLGEDGNVVLFGHSSYLPVVGNPAYKTFNNIQKLKPGDTVTVYSSVTAYTYRVKSFMKQSAAGDDGIPLSVSGKVLTLSTCDSFGTKTDRFVVTADFVESHPISA